MEQGRELSVYKLNTRRARADQVIANGVTIESGAQFSFTPVANKRLTAGTVFSAISNTAATQITGTFANLPDGSTFTAGPNTFQANYEERTRKGRCLPYPVTNRECPTN